jgi:hypothetical protein
MGCGLAAKTFLISGGKPQGSSQQDHRMYPVTRLESRKLLASPRPACFNLVFRTEHLTTLIVKIGDLDMRDILEFTMIEFDPKCAVQGEPGSDLQLS